MLEAASFVGNGTGDPTPYIQQAINAACNNGDWLDLGPRTFNLSAPLNIPAHIKLTGTGYQTSPITYGYGTTPASWGTRTSGFKGTALIGKPGQSIFVIDTTDSFSIEDMLVGYPTIDTSGVPAIN